MQAYIPTLPSAAHSHPAVLVCPFSPRRGVSVMRSWKHLLALPAAGALVAGLLVAGASPAAWSKPATPTVAAGQGKAAARSVNVATAAKGAPIAPQARSFGPLARDGRPTGTSLSAKSTLGAKPGVAATKTSGPNVRT